MHAVYCKYNFCLCGGVRGCNIILWDIEACGCCWQCGLAWFGWHRRTGDLV